VIVVEHRDQLARFRVEYLEAACRRTAGRIVVAGTGATTDDLVRGIIEVLARRGARLDGRRRGTRTRAMRAVTAATAPAESRWV
jgi:predicted site-specific integrase-resolvase